MGVKKQTENSCRFCSKIFCCTECRNAHEESKHPKSSCALCMKENLQFKAPDQKESETDISEFLYHLAVYHLPLYCKLCGSKYFSAADLTAATPCSWWRKRDSVKPPQTPRATPSSATVSSCDLMELTADAAERKQPLTPAKNHFRPGDNKSFLSAVEARLKQQSLHHLKHHSSPPELMRQTSTPVHGGPAGPPGQKPSYCPQFVFKTPSCEQLTFDTTGSACSRGTVSSSSVTESKYYTGHSNGFDAVVARLNLESDNTRDNHSPMTSILKKQLEPTPEQQEKKLERSILKPDVLERITRINESGEKRVRFSDQCNRSSVSTTTAEEGDLDAEADNEIFFEARDTVEDEGARKDDRAEDGDRDSPTSSTGCFEKLVTHLEEKRQTSVVVESCESTASQSSSVVMMLLVGQTDSNNLANLDLGPLIDSGLEKLKESVASANSSNTNKVTVISSVVNKVECLTTSFENESASACKPTRESQQESSPEEQPLADSSTHNTDGYKSDGIFSAVARVFRSALKKLPAVSSATSRNLAREPLSQTGFSPRSVQPTTSSYINSSRQASPVVPRSVNSVAAVASQHFLQRSSSKRPRERADSNEEPATATESSGSSNSRSSEIVSSPAAKRHRGWYRIKMREPIARMREQRQIVSPRGASLETQRFQQGSLTVGDQLVPLPSRAAHQSTQTGD